MGYYLPITDYANQQYRRRVERRRKTPYHIERSYKIIFHPIKKDDANLKRKLNYKHARIAKHHEGDKKKRRFSRSVSSTNGKGERINVQI